jgi:hypothetical protein
MASTTQAGVIHTNTSASLRRTSLRRRHRVFFNPWTEPTLLIPRSATP